MVIPLNPSDAPALRPSPTLPCYAANAESGMDVVWGTRGLDRFSSPAKAWWVFFFLLTSNKGHERALRDESSSHLSFCFSGVKLGQAGAVFPSPFVQGLLERRALPLSWHSEEAHVCSV